MVDSPRPHPAEDWRSLALLLALVIAIGGGVFVGLQQRADTFHTVGHDLAELNAAVNRLDALEWRCVAQGEVSDELREDLAEQRRLAESLLANFSRRDRAATAKAVAGYVAYRDAVNREIQTISAGDLAAAHEIDESLVDPAFSNVQREIAIARVELAAKASHSAWWSRFGALLTLALASAMIGFITWRAQEARRREALAQREGEELRASNNQLEIANTRLSEASRMKSEFLANMSHELRTPLTSLLGFLEILEDELCATAEERREFTQRAQVCGRNLLRLINDLLDMSKIESGKLSLAQERVDIEELLHAMESMFSEQARRKGLRFEIQCPPQAYAARADSQRLRQVLVNLIGNSLKFTEHGSVTLRVEVRESDSTLHFEVADTGVGIPKHQQHRVFEAFTQADGSATRRFGGTGIGLTLTRRLVEMMGGVISLESEGEGRGTRVWFALPLWSDAVPAAANPTGVVSGPESGPLVLVVEDDAQFRTWIEHLLHRHGLRTVCAGSADEAWLLVRRAQPQVLVIDYALPSASDADLRTGWDLAHRLGAELETQHIPFLFVSGFDQELRSRLESADHMRPRARLSKPFAAADLVGAIRRALGEASPCRQPRILLVDDDPSVPPFVRRLLPATEFSVAVASGGRECLRRLEAEPDAFDLLLLDLSMPDVSGYDVLRSLALRSNPPGPRVVVMSNAPEPGTDEERHLLRQGAVHVLSKSELHEQRGRLESVIHDTLNRNDGDSGRAPERRAA